jgi:hypothetical protein
MSTKFCPVCKKTKQRSKFNKNIRKYDGLQSICRKCQGARNLSDYHARPERRHAIYEAKHKRFMELQRQLAEYLNGKGCANCGNDDKDVLCFHHVGKKNFDISRALGNVVSWNKILIEIQLCQILCHNCHEKLHKIRRRESQGN